MVDELTKKREVLLEQVRGYRSCAVAFSGGVDSAVVAKAAQLELQERAIAITATSPSLAEGELSAAVELAALIGIRHEIIQTDEISNPRYTANGTDRCYFCKSELYSQLEHLIVQFDVDVVANGANADDRHDYRPGMRAAAEHVVRSPLAECGLNKAWVRRLAESWQLPVWDKPAMPCLASRIAYGEQVTPERLRMVDRAEQYVHSLGFREVRVRYHSGDLARIEVPAAEVAQLVAIASRQPLIDAFTKLGFKFVTVDLQGFRSGSLNAVIPLEAVKRGTLGEQSV